MGRLGTRSRTVLVAALAAAVTASAVALAGSVNDPSKSRVSTGAPMAAKAKKVCARKRGGTLRIAKRCRKNERPVKLAKRGPRGVSGEAGADGVAGPTGLAGATGPSGADGVAGPTGPAGDQGVTGTDGVNGTTTGETFFAQVSGSQTNFGGSGTNCTTTPTGPSITFTAPTGAYIQIMAEAELQRVGGNLAFVCLKVDGDAAFNIMETTSLAFEKRFLDKSILQGVTDKYVIDAYAFPVAAGSHTVSLQYGSDGGQSAFRNRKLWVTMFRPTS